MQYFFFHLISQKYFLEILNKINAKKCERDLQVYITKVQLNLIMIQKLRQAMLKNCIDLIINHYNSILKDKCQQMVEELRCPVYEGGYPMLPFNKNKYYQEVEHGGNNIPKTFRHKVSNVFLNGGAAFLKDLKKLSGKLFQKSWTEYLEGNQDLNIKAPKFIIMLNGFIYSLQSKFAAYTVTKDQLKRIIKQEMNKLTNPNKYSENVLMQMRKQSGQLKVILHNLSPQEQYPVFFDFFNKTELKYNWNYKLSPLKYSSIELTLNDLLGKFQMSIKNPVRRHYIEGVRLLKNNSEIIYFSNEQKKLKQELDQQQDMYQQEGQQLQI